MKKSIEILKSKNGGVKSAVFVHNTNNITIIIIR